MTNQNNELIIWRNGENLHGGIDAVLMVTKLSEALDLRYDRIVGLALLMQNAVLNIQRSNPLLYQHATHGINKLTEIGIADTQNNQIAENFLDPESKEFKITLNPKNLLTLFTKDIHLNPTTKEEVVRYFLTQSMAKIRQEQKVPTLQTAKQLSTQVLREADSTAIALLDLTNTRSINALNFLEAHHLTGMGHLIYDFDNKRILPKIGRDLSTKALLFFEKQYRNQGQSWLGYSSLAIKATQYPDIYQTAANRLALIAHSKSR